MQLSEMISIGVSAVVTIITGIIIWILKGYLADMKKYRTEREEKETAKDDLLLGIARVMLLENYNKAEKNGYYPLKDREVYSKLFESYQKNGGDGVIDQLAPKIRSLPTTPPNNQEGDGV